MEKTRKGKMSCDNGNIPMRQESVLSNRKKHYFRKRRRDMEVKGPEEIKNRLEEVEKEP